ncbi:somatic embryogenesis receptor kinase 4 [Vigna unguiculata]|uniref:Somatic embryogenesis receptor kinase 4 n=1 Tax=Vigna unguiculata TaxID=3917 RepID=A0A4D6KT72_VIGUN|nr:somatic embryogenesis receptor kinase 4 [Vigna unguiculata]
MGIVACISLVIMVTVFCPSSLALTKDGLTLLEIKSALKDTTNALSNWQESDETHCNWTGIYCHPGDEQRVRIINLPYLQLGGILSPSIGKLSGLQRLALHHNNLHGTIPKELTDCSDLRALYLRGNFFRGCIPSNIGNIPYLNILDLSSNSLKGAIPCSIGHLSQLQILNLTINSLSGEIPEYGVLSNFGIYSFEGNPGLCGRQIEKPCRTSLGFPVVLPHAESDQAAGKSSHFMTIMLIYAIAIMCVALVMVFAYLWTRLIPKNEQAAKRHTVVKKQKKQVHPRTSAKLIAFHGDLPYTSSEIVEKLEYLDEADIVGSGGYGTVYCMRIRYNRLLAVKQIDGSCEGSDQVFERELEVLGSIKHRNLVNMRGYLRLPSSRLLIYTYFPMGSVDDLLHEEDQQGRVHRWGDRLRIALGSARGLAYLHHECNPKIVHRNIKSSNVLLDECLEPYISDFGLADLLVDEKAHVTTVVAGTFGYLAPEYLQSGRATEKSDVYSFGVLLLELVTGKRPTDPSFVKRGLNVVGWVNTLMRDNRLEDVVDKRCRKVDPETVEVILELAARCTDGNADDRPSMNQVLQSLEQDVKYPPPILFYESEFDY